MSAASAVQGQGLGGSNATCIQLSSVPGGVTFAMRRGERSGYQPFSGASALQFWVKNLNSSTTIPALRVCIQTFVFKSLPVALVCPGYAYALICAPVLGWACRSE